MTIWLWKISPRLHLHPMIQPFEYELSLETNDHMIMKNLPGLHLHPMAQPFEYEFTLKPDDHMIMKNLLGASPAPDDSTIQIRVHLRTRWPYNYDKSPWDFICTRKLNHSNTSSPYNQMTIWLWKMSLGLHLHPKTQPFDYEFTLEPNAHMIMKNLPETSPAPDDSTIRIRVHLKTKWPCDYENSRRDFTCSRWLNH